jgi:hypothetical protein
MTICSINRCKSNKRVKMWLCWFCQPYPKKWGKIQTQNVSYGFTITMKMCISNHLLYPFSFLSTEYNRKMTHKHQWRLNQKRSLKGSEQGLMCFSHMWKIDPQDKCIHKTKHDQIHIYIENMYSVEGEKEGEEKRMIVNIMTHVDLCRWHNEMFWKLLNNE